MYASFNASRGSAIHSHIRCFHHNTISVLISLALLLSLAFSIAVSVLVARSVIHTDNIHSMCIIRENIPIYMKFILKIVFHIRCLTNLRHNADGVASLLFFTSCAKYWMKRFIFFFLFRFSYSPSENTYRHTCHFQTYGKMLPISFLVSAFVTLHTQIS